MADLQSLEEIREQWLYPFNPKMAYGNLNRPAQRLVESMEDAYKKNDPQLGTIYRALRQHVGAFTGINQVADAELFCAIIDSRQGRLAEASQRLTSAHALFRQGNFDHQQAVVAWMLGIILWARGGIDNQTTAFFHWQNCYDFFRERTKEKSVKPEQTKWYTERVKEIDKFLDTIKLF